MAKPKYMIADIDAATKAVNDVRSASDKVRGICAAIKAQTNTVEGLNATFSCNTQVANRYGQLEKLIGDTAPTLDEIANQIDSLVKQSRVALDASKGKMI